MTDVTRTVFNADGFRPVRTRFSDVLFAWSVGSVVLGLAAWFGTSSEPIRAIGSQFVVWGAIDLLFAAPGVVATRRPQTADSARSLLRALRFNVKLNWLWLLGSLAVLAWGVAAGSSGLVAHGVGATIQAAFLFGFDRAFARATQRFVPVEPRDASA